ncbi:OmpH family outer membrane protein [Piscinibacter koreensis]|uniref:OmpH family outer membrane protein n=1 Tax=Piscinibacter koreensis TaxID=2742824 RepID=A0A7Y6NSB9_9BURK|nr:OmpH family outer membrane protein [Schlegelella koreensis]NUZ08409.1 OmpH family outer membrane protein [Schlegelella koreensis]
MTKTLFFEVLVAMVVGAIGCLDAAAAGLKIGQVSSGRLLRDSAPAKAAEARLAEEFAQREKDLEALADRLKAATDSFHADSPRLSSSERAVRQRELLDQERDLQRKRRTYQDDLTQRRNEEVATVIEQTNNAIRKIFEAENYDLILQDSPFFGPMVDMTDKVINALGEKPGN